MLMHRAPLERKLDVMGLLAGIHAGGPKMARALAEINIEVPSSDIPSRFEPKSMPFSKVFFLEAASPWNGRLDLHDDETMKAVENYRKKK